MQQEKSLRVDFFQGSIIADIIAPLMLFMDIFMFEFKGCVQAGVHAYVWKSMYKYVYWSSL